MLTAPEAAAYSMAGPMLRASGVPYDLRRAEPYSIYDRFEFDVCTRPEGDVWARFRVRMDEIYQSLRILKQALDGLPEGPIMPPGKKQYQVRVPAGEAYARSRGRRVSSASTSSATARPIPIATTCAPRPSST